MPQEYPKKKDGEIVNGIRFPIIFAHRGANSYAPENSLAAFKKAMEMGCDGIELDVRMCQSGEVVVFHDRHTDRMTGTTGIIHKMPLQQIKELYLKHAVYTREKIPLLQEVLDLAGNKVLINIDVKKPLFANNRIEEHIVQILRNYSLENNILISSFNPSVLKKFALLNPRLHLGFIFSSRTSIFMLNGHPVKSLHARYHILSRRYFRRLTQRANHIYAWTVDTEKGMLEQIKNGIHGIITNKPELFFLVKQKLVQSLENVYPDTPVTPDLEGIKNG